MLSLPPLAHWHLILATWLLFINFPKNFSLALCPCPLPLTTYLLVLALTNLDYFCPSLPCLAPCLAPYRALFLSFPRLALGI